MHKHDVFVSYAHADDEVPFGEANGWVTTFVDELRKILRRKIGRKGADIWTDHQLASNAKVTATLFQKVQSTRTIVLFLSNGYLKSDWCQREIDQFLEQNSAHKNKESVFVVELDSLPREQWPPRLRELKPICLYEKDAGSGIPALLRYPRPPGDSNSPYWKRLNELAHFITEHLKLLESTDAPTRFGSLEQSISNNRDVPPPSRVAWVAQPPDALVEAWESIVAALRQQGAQVLPLGRSAYSGMSAGEFRIAVESHLAGAGILVQLLDVAPGMSIGAGPDNACSVQAMLGKLRHMANPSVPFLQWRSADIDLDAISDLNHRAMLQGTIASGFETFRQGALDAFNALSQPKVTPIARRPNGQSLSVCITAGPKDVGFSVRVSDIVRELGHAPLPAPPGPEPGQLPSEYRTQFENLLSEVDGVILVLAGESSIWIQSRYAQSRKVFAQRKRGIWGAVVDGSPRDRPASTFGGPDIMRLDCRDGVKRAPIERFIETLRSEGSHA